MMNRLLVIGLAVCHWSVTATIAGDEEIIKEDIDEDLHTGTPPAVVLMLWMIAAGMIYWFYREVSKIRKDWMSAVFVVDGHSLSGLRRRRLSRRRPSDTTSAMGNARLSQFEAENQRAMAVSQMRDWQRQEQTDQTPLSSAANSSDDTTTTTTAASILGSSHHHSHPSSQNHYSNSSTSQPLSNPSTAYAGRFRVISDNLSLFQASAAEAISNRLNLRGSGYDRIADETNTMVHTGGDNSSNSTNSQHTVGMTSITGRRTKRKKISLTSSPIMEEEEGGGGGGGDEEMSKADTEAALGYPLTNGTHVLSMEGGSSSTSHGDPSTTVVRSVDDMYASTGSRFGSLLRTAKKKIAGNGDYIEV